MAITSIARDWGYNPAIVRITSTDFLGNLVTPGYLNSQAANISALNNGQFDWDPSDMVAISYLGGKGFFNVDDVINYNFIPLSEITDVVHITAAQIIAMSVTPFLIIPAFGAHTVINVINSQIECIFGTTQFTGGGATGLEYGPGVALGNTKATATVAGATVDGWAADNMVTLLGALASTASSNVVNQGLYLSNDTAAFAAGDSTFQIHVTYNVLNTVV